MNKNNENLKMYEKKWNSHMEEELNKNERTKN